ncbi:pilus assembly protein PilZ [Marispirochaeta aestuarii]|uniref:Pilus assembly protein PilZ n=1 Tax=Marispirochaeta aestuarii TaxID=1963862 RepID=A0A1Y1RVW2_9SPIO|nr:pilus assembly protein PilZ [Marispirochaeta aestuarii]
MALITSQQLSRFFERYNDVNLTFTKDVVRATRLLQRNTHIKCLGDHWPCVLYSCSMKGAKVIASLSKSFYEKLKSANNLVTLHLAFAQEDKSTPLSFFVTSKINGFTPYDKSKPNLNFLSLEYTQRPPDDLIVILGTLAEANINSSQRREERIEITADTIRKLGLKSKTGLIYIDGIPRKCIIRDLSFSGSKLILPGIGKFLLNKNALLRFELSERNKQISLDGSVVRTENVAGRKDLIAAAVKFEEPKVPYEYKLLINDYLNTLRSKKGNFS